MFARLRFRRAVLAAPLLFTFLLLTPFAFAQPDEEDGASAPTADDSAPERPPFAHVPQMEADGAKTASFSDGNQGKITWRIERGQLPWRGSYSFLSKSDAAHPTVLLTVLDATTGLKVADCQTPVSAREPHRGWRGELDRAFHWHRVNWELDEEALQCNTTADLKTIRSALQTSDSQAFLVRISAARGPRCIRNLYADEEEWSGCPPKFSRMHDFSSTHLKCGCADGNSTAAAAPKEGGDERETTEETPQNDDAEADRSAATTEEPEAPMFGNVRRKPLPGRSPPAVEERAGSTEETAPAFPMFQFTNSMEKVAETEATNEPTAESSTVAETTSQQQAEATETTAEATPTETEGTAASTAEEATIPTTLATAEDETTPAADTSETAAAEEANGGEEPQSCDSFECLNNGTCVEGKQPTCKCPEGFEGVHCERDLCKELGCQNGGKCKVRNGRAVCACPSGLHGEKCHQLQPTCNPPCENGGVCSLVQNQPMCKCPHGFLGSNCNLRDLCASDTTCGIYGADAKCFKEAADLFRYSPVLQDATYSCQCPTGNGYAECNSTSGSQERFGSPFPPAIATPLPARPQQSTFRTAPTVSAGDTSGATSFAIENSAAVGDTSSAQGHALNAQSGEGGAQFPIHTTAVSAASNVDGRPTIQHVIGTSPEDELPASPPQFPLTSLTPQSAASASPTILPRPSPSAFPSAASSALPTTAEFTRLPDLHHVFATSTPAQSAGGGDENDGDAGFERMTQFVAETTPAAASTSGEQTAAGGAVGPEHSIEGAGGSNELQPEFHTMPPPPSTDSSAVPEAEIEEAETPPPFAVGPTAKPRDEAAVEAGNADAERGGQEASGSWQWIVALAVIGVLLIAATIGGVFMARYVRRSRRLHGKYNPAKEEGAIAHANFAIPMTNQGQAVNKDERLI
ncbi:Abnormal pharyngeal pumping eat-20 [Aphelenchoides fujianensis]|nr:Abnormal pharyngeal pumping eat-20 [Aphelenchoides fujianensis]